MKNGSVLALHNTMPSGTVTYLFTDIEGSTQLWEDHPDLMALALRRHDEIMRHTITENGGIVFKTIGDAFCAAFSTAAEALKSAVDGQLALRSEPWPSPVKIQVRMGLHTGVAELRDLDYFGPALNRVARLMSAGHGGQVLVSLVTTELARNSLQEGCELISLGKYTLRGFATSEPIFQVHHPDLLVNFPPLKSVEQVERLGNLSAPLSSFVGRLVDTETVKRLSESARMITIVGAGGTGKTRLAVQVANELRDQFDGGSWMVELAPISDAQLVQKTVADLLGVSEKPGQSMTKMIADFVGSSRVLLILDNCEHLIDGCATTAAALLQACPNLMLIATSREPLNIPGEQVFRIYGLYVPTYEEASTPEDLEKFEATRLFIERARSAKPDFVVTPLSLKSAIEICASLDGIPMAIELAAARTRTLTLEDIYARLSDRFRLLKSVDRSAAPRQQTLRALIDWSFESLNEHEKILLERLSVFPGSWSLDAAESVCADEPIDALDVFDLQTALVDKSLVIASELRGQARFKLLETVREYSRERLAESGQERSVRISHIRTYLELAESVETELKGPNQKELLEKLETEHDNFRIALIATNELEPHGITGARLVAALGWFWFMRGHWTEGVEAVQRELARLESNASKTALDAKLLSLAAWFALGSDRDRARTYAEKALERFRSLEDKLGSADVLNFLGILSREEGQYSVALSEYIESRDLFRALGDVRGEAHVLNNLGLTALYGVDVESSERYLAQGLALVRKTGNKREMALLTSNFGYLYYWTGDFESAKRYLAESTAIAMDLGDRWLVAFSQTILARVLVGNQESAQAADAGLEGLHLSLSMSEATGIYFALDALAEILAAENHLVEAVRVRSSTDSYRRTHRVATHSIEAKFLQSELETARASIGEAAFERAWSQGQDSTIEDATSWAIEQLEAFREQPLASLFV